MSTLISSVEACLGRRSERHGEGCEVRRYAGPPGAEEGAGRRLHTIEAVTSLVSPQAANIERLGFAVLGVVIKAIDDAGTAAGASGLNVSLDAQLIADIKSIAEAVKGAAHVAAA
jgi:hypothetical protein